MSSLRDGPNVVPMKTVSASQSEVFFFFFFFGKNIVLRRIAAVLLLQILLLSFFPELVGRTPRRESSLVICSGLEFRRI